MWKRCPLCAGDGPTQSLIQPGTMKCSDNAARLIYRSSVETTGSQNASEIVQIIKEWVTSSVPGEATLQLWPFIMDLDSRCSVPITSAVNVCIHTAALPSSVVIAIAVVSVVLFIPLVLLIVMVVILCLWTCFRQRQETGKAAIYESADKAKSGFGFAFSSRRRNGGSSRIHQLALDSNVDSTSLHSRNEAKEVGELNPIFNSEAADV